MTHTTSGKNSSKTFGTAPHFVIAGAPKSGTTALFSYLETHPDIFVCRPKEPHFFAPDLPDFFVKARTEQAYQALFQTALPHQLCGEGSVLYAWDEKALSRLLAYQPDCKVILIVRHPIAMAQSWHNQSLKVLFEEEQDFEKAWDLIPRRQQGLAIPKGCPDARLLNYADICSVGQQLIRAQKTVPEHQLLVILYDDLATNPHSVYQKTLSFLGVADDGRTDFPVMNASVRLRSKASQKFMAQPPAVLQAVQPFLKTISNAVGLRPGQALRRFNRPQTQKTALPLPVQEKLCACFAQDIEILTQFFGKTPKIQP